MVNLLFEELKDTLTNRVWLCTSLIERRTFNSVTTIPSILDYLEEYYDLDIAAVRARKAAKAV
jgi:hypothetical protein